MSKTVYTLLVEEVADTHFKRIGDLMQPADGDVTPTVDPVDRLPTNAEQAGQTSVTHVFSSSPVAGSAATHTFPFSLLSELCIITKRVCLL